MVIGVWIFCKLLLNKSMKNRIARLAKEGGWVLFGQISSVLGLILSIKILTQYLSPSIYGDVAIGLTIATLINQLVFGPISAGVLRLYSEAHQQDCIGDYYSGVLSLTHQVSKLMALPAVLICIVLFFYLGISVASTFTFAFGLSIAVGYGAIFSAIETARRRRAAVSIHQGLEPILRMIFIILLIKIFEASSQIVLLAYFSSNIILAISQYLFLKKNGIQIAKNSFEKKIWAKKIWTFTLPITIWGGFTAIQLLSDKWSLQLFDLTSQVGLYAVVFQLGYFPIQALSGLATQFLTPIVYQRYESAYHDSGLERVEKINRILANSILLVTLVCFYMAIYLHQEVFTLLTSTVYLPASKYLPWMILSSGFFAAGQTLSLNLMASMQTKFLMHAKIFTAIFAVILNCAGAYYLGLKGVVFASLAFSILFYFSLAIKA